MPIPENTSIAKKAKMLSKPRSKPASKPKSKPKSKSMTYDDLAKSAGVFVKKPAGQATLVVVGILTGVGGTLLYGKFAPADWPKLPGNNKSDTNIL